MPEITLGKPHSIMSGALMLYYGAFDVIST